MQILFLLHADISTDFDRLVDPLRLVRRQPSRPLQRLVHALAQRLPAADFGQIRGRRGLGRGQCLVDGGLGAVV